jgi:hypothetical protein
LPLHPVPVTSRFADCDQVTWTRIMRRKFN